MCHKQQSRAGLPGESFGGWLGKLLLYHISHNGLNKSQTLFSLFSSMEAAFRDLGQWFTNLSMHQNPVENILKADLGP